MDKRRVLIAWKLVSQWIASHKRPTQDPVDTFGEFSSCIHRRDTKYQTFWRKALKARATAARAQLALRGYQKIQRQNLKEALKKYLSHLTDQAAKSTVDWWEKLKPLRVEAPKGKKYPSIYSQFRK